MYANQCGEAINSTANPFPEGASTSELFNSKRSPIPIHRTRSIHAAANLMGSGDQTSNTQHAKEPTEQIRTTDTHHSD